MLGLATEFLSKKQAKQAYGAKGPSGYGDIIQDFHRHRLVSSSDSLFCIWVGRVPRRWRVIVIGSCVCVFLCLCVTANLCNGLLLKILDHCYGKSTLGLLQDSSDLRENSLRAKIQLFKVKKWHFLPVTIVA